MGRPMIDLRSRLLAAVMSNGLKEDVGNPKSRCNGVTAFDLLQNSVVTLSPPVTPQSSYEIAAVTPSHPDSTDREAQEQNRADPKENSPGWPYSRVLAALRERCPERVEEHRWELAVMDAQSHLQLDGVNVPQPWAGLRMIFSILRSFPSAPHRTFSVCHGTTRPGCSGCCKAERSWL